MFKTIGSTIVLLIVGAFVGVLLTILLYSPNEGSTINATNWVILTNIKPGVVTPVLITNNNQVCIDTNEWGIIYDDYVHYSTDDFKTSTSNDTVSVALWKRKTVYKVPKPGVKRFIIGAGYPLNLLLGVEVYEGFGLYGIASMTSPYIGISYRF